MVTSSKMAYATHSVPQVLCSQRHCSCSRSLLTHASAWHTQTLKGRSGSVSVGSLGPGECKVLFEPSTSLRVYLWDFWALHSISLVYLFILSLILHCPDYYKLYWLLHLYSKPWSFVVPVFPLCFSTPILCQLFCLCLYMYTLELIYQYPQSHLVKFLFGSHWNCSLTWEALMHWQIEVLHGRCLIYAGHLVLLSIL